MHGDAALHRIGAMRRFALLLLLLGSLLAMAGDKNFSDIKIKVLKDENGKPLRNAVVVLHAVSSKGKQASGGLNLKTDQDGETSYNGIPYGKLRIQVISHGFQTYGADIEVNQPAQEIVVKMKPPQKQYSIYDQPGAKPPQIDPDKN